MTESNKKAISRTKQLCFCSLFAAIVCVCTLISIPLPIGYFNLGDAAVLLCGWLFGPLLGGISAAVGSALADVLIGYAVYAPATAVIKALMVVCAWAVATPFVKRCHTDLSDIGVRVFASVVAEAVMVCGYLFYEAIVLSYGVGALASVAGNTLQGVFGVTVSALVYAILKKRGVFDRISRAIK